MFSKYSLACNVKMFQANLLFRKCQLVKRSMCSISRKDKSFDKIEEGFVTINDRKIKYVRTGYGPHAVLCCPGALGSAWTDLKHQIFGLDRRKLTVVAWDPPGYGQSRPPGRDLKPGFLQREADLAYGLMKALDLSNFSVLGWSAGSLPAFFLGATYPENVKKLVVWGTLTHVSDEAAQKLENIRDVSVWPDSLKAKYIELYGFDEFRTMWDEWISTLIRINREKENGDICLSEMKKISCPLLVLHGNEDHIVSLEHAKLVAQAVPGAEFHSFKKGRHNIHEQYHEEFNSRVMDFLLKPRHNVVN